MFAIRESEQFEQKGVKPARLARQVDLSALDLGGFRHQPVGFAAIGFSADPGGGDQGHLRSFVASTSI